MLHDLILSTLVEHFRTVTTILITVLITVYLLQQKYQEGLNKYPGPFIASLTNHWRVLDVWKRDTHVTYQKLHQKYGDIVRVGPRVLSFGHPNAIADIYGLNKGYTKASSYTLNIITET